MCINVGCSPLLLTSKQPREQYLSMSRLARWQVNSRGVAHIRGNGLYIFSGLTDVVEPPARIAAGQLCVS